MHPDIVMIYSGQSLQFAAASLKQSAHRTSLLCYPKRRTNISKSHNDHQILKFQLPANTKKEEPFHAKQQKAVVSYSNAAAMQICTYIKQILNDFKYTFASLCLHDFYSQIFHCVSRLHCNYPTF